MVGLTSPNSVITGVQLGLKSSRRGEERETQILRRITVKSRPGELINHRHNVGPRQARPLPDIDLVTAATSSVIKPERFKVP